MTGDAGSVRAARSFVSAAITGVRPWVQHTAVLLAHELVTNAVSYGGGRFCVSAGVEPGTVRVTVADTRTDGPRVLHPGPESEHGRGMAIVDALASRWGTRRLPWGKVVWFELDRGS